VSATAVNKLTTGRTDRRPGKAQAPPGTKATPLFLSGLGKGLPGCDKHFPALYLTTLRVWRGSLHLIVVRGPTGAQPANET
ncbi:hypothetical protein, partial [Klebsiella quasipneumoniae]|uniref:hypothetical protein n=1 Tax=Klebsiella quasipneumoniae TaxID=1463165 RepID=UPI001C52B27A